MSKSDQGSSSLSEKQRRFAEEYLIDLNGTKAAIRAGYSEKAAPQQAVRLLSYAKVQAAIQKGQQAAQKRSQRTMDDVLADLRKVATNAMQAVPDAEGNLVMVNHGAAIKAIELEGKHYGGFVNKQELSGSVAYTIETAIPRDPDDPS